MWLLWLYPDRVGDVWLWYYINKSECIAYYLIHPYESTIYLVNNPQISAVSYGSGSYLVKIPAFASLSSTCLHPLLPPKATETSPLPVRAFDSSTCLIGPISTLWSLQRIFGRNGALSRSQSHPNGDGLRRSHNAASPCWSHPLPRRFGGICLKPTCYFLPGKSGAGLCAVPTNTKYLRVMSSWVQV